MAGFFRCRELLKGTVHGGKERLQHKVPAASLVPLLERQTTANMTAALAARRTNKEQSYLVLCSAASVSLPIDLVY